MSEIDCCYTDKLVCPYCGCEHEIDGEYYNDSRYDCAECERHFAFKADFSVHFTSSTLEDEYNSRLRAHRRNLEVFKDDPEMRALFEQAIKETEDRLAALPENAEEQAEATA